MRVAILGSRGFLGSRIASEATRRGWTVNHIGSKTANAADLIGESDAVIHSVGAFMADPRYKKLVSEPISVCSLAKLVGMRLGLDPPSPLAKSLEDMNLGTVQSAVEALKHRTTHKETPEHRIPFVYMSAANWELADPKYIESKRRAEQLLGSVPGLRPVYLRPGLIVPPRARSLGELTPRHLVDLALLATNSPSRVSVEAVAEAACDAVSDNTIEGIIECDAIQELQNIH